jgi:hypothetical protein
VLIFDVVAGHGPALVAGVVAVVVLTALAILPLLVRGRLERA